ncbi:MBL fold metallo-hydrolase [Flavitalea sp. BT771]|uniref:MBL fold metallo-hydrolase n=1 Tax=Flavitalea sp. BT771 TaxID=3063329 RepID=UPI0026E21E48|nr:MBL fold metallo-hydrolase [Flavitalea sp. BT771]MDO6430356.1 MBL fold metallo-hydrolase [Flavitalea sp. BT771]MDV6219504.1 MBL fold metallo-hydrolase [Flavitalea sp. BT771]
MKIEQIYTGCLAQGAYYIESKGEAAIVDPLREVEPYIQKAEKDNARIKYVLETHFHADFVSGHLDLARRTGATIVYGPNANPSFEAQIAGDNEELKLGDITIKALHTPGHTMESTCYLVIDEYGQAKALFSGDTLFIGDVGRPDLAQKVTGLTKEELAGLLYDSLNTRIIPLPDDVVVYPAHGAGSACGKKMSSETTDTLGHQKATNYALRPGMSKEEFIREITTGLVPPPSYFPFNVLLNKMGYERIDQVIRRGERALTPEAFERQADETGALILDTRDPEVFAAGFIPNSINIGIDGNFAPWAGALIPDINQRILLITEEGREEEVIIRLARVGLDHTIGYLSGGFAAWKAAGKEMDSIDSVTATELAVRLKRDFLPILDVRKNSEYHSEHVVGAVNIPLDLINDHLPDVQKDTSAYVHCAGGYRSMIFISILRARGYSHLVNVRGGFKAIKACGEIPVTDYASPTSLL